MSDINNKLTNTTVFILNSFIHITFIFSFLTFLFIYIITPLATQKLHDELDGIIYSAINNAIPNQIDLSLLKNDLNKRQEFINKIVSACQPYYAMDSITSLFVKAYISNLIDLYSDEYYNHLLNIYKQPNYLITLHNKSIVNYSFYISIILLVVTVILILADKLSCSPCINISKLFFENLFVCIIVGIAEYSFFVNYAFKYDPIPPSLLISSSINNIKSLL
jgi:hypothetical protein